MSKTKEKRLSRSEVPKELTWNLTDLFATESDWEVELTHIQQEANQILDYQGTLHNSAETLLNCLLSQEKLSMKFAKASSYAYLRKATDGTDYVNQSNSSKISSLKAKVDGKLSFIESEILELPDGLIEQFLQTEPNLEPFRKYLQEVLEGKKHRFSPETEKVLAALGEVLDAPYQIFGMSKLTDMEFSSIEDKNGNELPVSFSLFETRYEFSPNNELRRKAYKSFVQTLQQYKNTFATTYSTEVKKQVTLSSLRNYQSVTEMLLHPQKVTETMYHNQLDIIFTELAPHMRRFAALKKKILGVDEMLFCDLKAPIDFTYNPAISYEEASTMILEALQVMGPEYMEIMEKGLKERWIDLSDNIGKSTGAFCSSPYGSHPYILITWQNTMRNVFTLAHELGHAGHFYLANKNQRIHNTRPSTYFVEAPSTMNELLLAQHLFKKTNDPQMRRWLVLQLLGTYYHNFVTHVLEGEYQRRVYQTAESGHALTASTLSSITGDVLTEFWGDAVSIDEGAKLTWMRQPHYYMGLYPYTYSAGLTASTAVSQMIQEQGQTVVEKWLDVLRAGGTMAPLDLMKHTGVDMSKPDPIRTAVAYVGSLVDELENSYQ
ncbi:oligoendopeptidase F [Bacillus mesophilus]|uniref:Oligopeptidase F n=1 Tax=Bacillus mesophilus TaxID=1808955 RepID=A0A6M0QE42_9BACI|nr:oligoendopeptidase F [Bacillus mesophilus]NEY74159.1 oligoendopeptidase F [Bacillus mesophilus]